jgi:hypothetical protein
MGGVKAPLGFMLGARVSEVLSGIGLRGRKSGCIHQVRL